MKKLTTGRNQPCPCGSGKKYKRCCLGKEDSTTSSGSDISPSEALRQALAGQQFNSLEEAQAFATLHAQEQNRRPLERFDGLSPNQMYQILYLPFTSPELARIPEVLAADPTAPILTLFELLADAIGEAGLKPTTKGNLPRNFCREAALSYWGEQKYRKNTQFRNIMRELDFAGLHITRVVAEQAGLIRKYKGRFILSRACRRLLDKHGMSAIYPKLLRTYVTKFNWAYRDGFPDLQLMQDGFLFTLYLLTRHGDSWRPPLFYEDLFLRAFPMLLDDESLQDQIFSPDDTVRRCYEWRVLVRFADFLGLAAMEPVIDNPLDPEYRVKALPLLGEAVQFQLPDSQLSSKW